MSRDLSGRRAWGAKAERDRKLELALQHELRASGTPARDACVDAETLGAWADGGLDAVQMAAVELHVSTCARCQAIVGVAVRSAPVIAPVTNEGWFRLPRWALVPVAAAAAVAIWMVVPQDTTQAPPAPAAERRQDAPQKDTDAIARNSAAPSPSKELADASDARPTAPRTEFREAKPQRANATPPALQDRDQRREEPTAARGAAASSAAPAAPLAEATPQHSTRLAVAPLEIVSPDASRRWRIANAAIERSDDGGVSWISAHTLSGQTITGGAAPARSVCWLIGADGMVMLTSDGITFTEVRLPERADVAAIVATDARSATVTTADGRRYRTDDSGRTWRQLSPENPPLQEFAAAPF
ncbi:MAG: zf-HC2 domain-containing protein [Vicinamibacterales bacterium]